MARGMTYAMIPETMSRCLGTSILLGSIWRMTSRSCQNKSPQRHGGRPGWQTSCWSWGHLTTQTDGVRVVKMRLDMEKECTVPMEQRFGHKDNNSTPIIVTLVCAIIALLGFLDSPGLCASPRTSRQEEVATKGAKIMPFD